jgi:wyosine [tRNA(Phe)-imidazoG37] synthetase (radical SAM superfamily)
MPAQERQKEKKFLHIYGPVPSRRLGFSLGLDILPLKTCTQDCVYCQLGSDPKRALQRKEYFPAKKILAELREALALGRRADYITFSGSGEPTLNSAIGQLIRETKKMTDIPVAVLTNSSLLYRKDVRRALAAADVVAPSLDAASQGVFEAVNRPFPGLKLKKVLAGLAAFRNEFKGKLWLEVMLVKGLNDDHEHLQKLKEAVAIIKPDKIHLNTVVRPPAQKWARPVSQRELQKIKIRFGANCEVIADFAPKTKTRASISGSLEEAILSLVRRRPVTTGDIAASLGRSESRIRDCLDSLLKRKRIQPEKRKGSIFYKSR